MFIPGFPLDSYFDLSFSYVERLLKKAGYAMGHESRTPTGITKTSRRTS